MRVEQINQGANIRAIDRFTVTAGIGHHDMRGSLTTNLMMARNGGHLDDTDGPLLSPVLARQWMDCTAEAAFDSKENIDKLFSNNESNSQFYPLVSFLCRSLHPPFIQI